MNISLFIDEKALAGPEQTRQILLREIGHAPPLESIIAVFLAEPDPEEIATALLTHAMALRYQAQQQAGQARLPGVTEVIGSPRGELPLSSEVLNSSSGAAKLG
jgi:hypothetical protein